LRPYSDMLIIRICSHQKRNTSSTGLPQPMSSPGAAM
jgi:hypothetical protein